MIERLINMEEALKSQIEFNSCILLLAITIWSIVIIHCCGRKIHNLWLAIR